MWLTLITSAASIIATLVGLLQGHASAKKDRALKQAGADEAALHQTQDTLHAIEIGLDARNDTGVGGLRAADDFERPA